MKYAVTFCATDEKVGANPLWHACVFFSKMDEATKKLEVVDTWGFYGLPATDSTNSLLRQAKIKLRLDVNIFGNHGKWRHEETRFLDRGEGLHGRTFELTEEQFTSLQQHFIAIEKEETEAIQEIAAFLKLKPKAEPRIYAYENNSPLIFAIENAKAKEEGRPSRLHPFEFRPGWDWIPHLTGPALWGPNLRDSQSCKSQAIDALRSAQTADGQSVLSQKQINELTVNGRHPSVPRYSGAKMEDIYLHSTGPLQAHTKKSGAKAHYRQELGVEETRLFWTLPPQQADFLTEDSKALCTIDPDLVSQTGSVLSKLQRLEWLLHDAQVAEPYQRPKQNLINTVIRTYEAFAGLVPKTNDQKVGGYTGFFLHLLSLPKSAAEQEFRVKLGNARALLNSVYMAMVDGWKLELSDEDCPEAVATYLSLRDKKAICAILGRTYLDADLELERAAANDEDQVKAASDTDYTADDQRLMATGPS